MGIKTSGTVFQHIIDEMLGDLKPKCAVTYIDDIVIFFPSMKQQILDVESILNQLMLI